MTRTTPRLTAALVMVGAATILGALPSAARAATLPPAYPGAHVDAAASSTLQTVYVSSDAPDRIVAWYRSHLSGIKKETQFRFKSMSGTSTKFLTSTAAIDVNPMAGSPARVQIVVIPLGP